MSQPVNARIPLSLLESIRRIDTPEDQTDTEYVPELRNKRLGLSDTVYTQIRRYTEAMKRGQKIPFAEAEGLGTLIGRRPDAEELFRNAGLILAKDIYESIAAPTRSSINVLPRFASLPMALKQLTQIGGKYFGGSVEKNGSSLTLRVPDSVTVNGSPNSAGCEFYGVAFGELIRLLTGGETTVDHIRCTARGDGACEWRAEVPAQQ
jgi:predicted hydrocarbon binding protein